MPQRLQIEYVKIGDVKPYDGNTKLHPEKQIKLLAESLKNYGWVKPLVVDDDLVLIAGHGILEAAKLNKFKTVPVIKASHLSERQRKAFVIADNKLAELSKWDFDTLSKELSDLISVDIDVAGLGFDEQEIESLLQMEPEILPENFGKVPVVGHERLKTKKTTPNAIYGLIIECTSEAEATARKKTLESQGYKCKVTVLAPKS